MSAFRWLWVAMVWVGVTCWLTPLALARPSFNSELLAPTSDNGPYLTTFSARTLGQYKFTIGATFDVAHRPLELADPGGGRISGIVEDLFMVHILGSFGILDWFQVGADVAVAPVDRLIDDDTGVDFIRFRMSDIRLDLKFRILDPDRYGWGIAAIPFAIAPTGSDTHLVGNGVFAGGAKLAFETPNLGNRLRVALNVGYLLREGTNISGTEVDDFVLYSMAMNFRITDYFEIIPEIFGQSVATNLFKNEIQSPLEMGGSAQIHVLEKLSLDFGGSAGVLSGIGAPVWRAFVRIAYNPVRRAPLVPKPPPETRIPLTQAEIYELTKKCPPPDQFDPATHDSACEKIYELRAIRGQCPSPEDFDPALHDEACEKVFVLQQYDVDGDGVADYLDRCPDDRGPVENDGCPTYGVVTIDWLEGRVKSDKFHFAFNSYELSPQTRDVLNRVAQELKPKLDYFKRLLIEGHTDAIGLKTYNDWLSRQRADAVRSYLVEQGIPTAKMRSVGYGQTQPVATNSTEAGQQQNRRVEIKLELEHQPAYAPVSRPAPAVETSPPAGPVSPPAPVAEPTAAPPPTEPGQPLVATEPPILDPGLSTGRVEEEVPLQEPTAKQKKSRRGRSR